MRLPSSREIVSYAQGGEDRIMVLENKEKNWGTAYLANRKGNGPGMKFYQNIVSEFSNKCLDYLLLFIMLKVHTA